jgi:hypothetical protein
LEFSESFSTDGIAGYEDDMASSLPQVMTPDFCEVIYFFSGLVSVGSIRMVKICLVVVLWKVRFYIEERVMTTHPRIENSDFEHII